MVQRFAGSDVLQSTGPQSNDSNTTPKAIVDPVAIHDRGGRNNAIKEQVEPMCPQLRFLLGHRLFHGTVAALVVSCIVAYLSWYLRPDIDPFGTWANFQGNKCVSYGVREYKARLKKVIHGVEPLKACRETPGTYEGVSLGLPLGCVATSDSMQGWWHVPVNDHCMPRWGKLRDDGCSTPGSNQRRFSSRLWNINSGDWTAMCQTTPIDIAGYHFEHPDHCTKGKFKISGIRGNWLLPDDSCV